MYSLAELVMYSDMGLDKLEVYNNLMNQVKTKNIMLEIGTRLGGTAMLGINNFNVVLSVDCYGNKPYSGPSGVMAEYQYPDTMYLEMLINVSSYALQMSKNFIHYKMTSLDFLNSNFNLWLDAAEIPVKELKYDFVLLDGDHRYEQVIKEVNLLSGRIHNNGIIAIDNVDWWGIGEKELLEKHKIKLASQTLGIGYIIF